MRSVFSITTPLPATVSRDVAVNILHDHAKMIELNPLVIDHKPTRPPKEAPADEFHCTWYEVTDRMSWLPGVKGTLKIHVCFNDIPTGVQTHVYAPMGLDIQEKWSIGGNLPGEPREPRELGINVPRDVLYLREDVNMNVSRIFTNYTKTKLNKAHATLVDRLLLKGEIIEDVNYQTVMSDTMSRSDGSSIRGPLSPRLNQAAFEQQRPSPNPYRVSAMSGLDQKSMPSPPMYPSNADGNYPHDPTAYGKSFPAELPDNVPPPAVAELYSPRQPPQGGMTHGPSTSTGSQDSNAPEKHYN